MGCGCLKTCDGTNAKAEALSLDMVRVMYAKRCVPVIEF